MGAAEERRCADTGPGYDGPSDDSSVLARISALSSAAGMQAYPPEPPGVDTMMLGGQVVVLDVGARTGAGGARVVRWLRRGSPFARRGRVFLAP